MSNHVRPSQWSPYTAEVTIPAKISSLEMRMKALGDTIGIIQSTQVDQENRIALLEKAVQDAKSSFQPNMKRLMIRVNCLQKKILSQNRAKKTIATQMNYIFLELQKNLRMKSAQKKLDRQINELKDRFHLFEKPPLDCKEESIELDLKTLPEEIEKPAATPEKPSKNKKVIAVKSSKTQPAPKQKQKAKPADDFDELLEEYQKKPPPPRRPPASKQPPPLIRNIAATYQLMNRWKDHPEDFYFQEVDRTCAGITRQGLAIEILQGFREYACKSKKENKYIVLTHKDTGESIFF